MAFIYIYDQPLLNISSPLNRSTGIKLASGAFFFSVTNHTYLWAAMVMNEIIERNDTGMNDPCWIYGNRNSAVSHFSILCVFQPIYLGGQSHLDMA